ncbi:MAG: glycosyltransferase family 2 protein [Bdellovibrionota bacterium]
MQQSISVVIPVYNEEESVKECYTEVKKVLEKMGRPYEIIFIDDGSKDETLKVLKECAKDDFRLVIIEFRRNFGQTAAMAAGFENSRGDIVIPMDGDLQNDPNEIPMMVEKLEEGYDLVAGWRKKRQDKKLTVTLPSKIGNKIIAKITGVYLHDNGCTLKVMTGEVARGIKLYGEMHRFIAALANEMGAKIVEVPVNHRERKYGKSKYGLSKATRVFLDLILVKFLLGYSKRPIHLFGLLGLISELFSFILFIYLTFQRFYMHIPMGNRPLLSIAVMLAIIGIQFIVFGIIAEMQVRTYYESQDKKIYRIRNVFNYAPKGGI